MSHVHGSHIGQRQSGFVSGASESTGGQRVVSTHARTGVNQQVTADGARVGDLAFAHRCGAGAGSCLAETADLVNDAAQVAGLLLMQAGCHRQRDG